MYTKKDAFMKIWGYKNYVGLKRICNILNIPYNDCISDLNFLKILEYHNKSTSEKMKIVWSNRTIEEKELIASKGGETQRNKSDIEKRQKEEKRRKTCLEKYGVYNPSLDSQVKSKISNSWKLKRENYCKKYNCTPLLDVSEYNSSNYNIDKIAIKNIGSNFIKYEDIFYIQNKDIDEFKKERNRLVRLYKGEKYIEDYLIYKKLPYVKQKSFENCKYKHKLLFDFMIGDNILLEINGIQHYKSVDYYSKDGKHQFEEQIKKDSIKEKFCKDNNFKLIVIPWLCKNINTKEQLISALEKELD